MPDYKVTLLITTPKHGISETWYKVESNLTNIVNAARSLAIARAALLGIGAYIEGWRISDLLTPYAGRVIEETILPPTKQGPPSPGDNRDQAQAGLLARIGGQFATQRQLWIRACPDAWVVWNPALAGFTPTAAARGAFVPFKTFLFDNSWCLRCYNKSDFDNPPYRVISVTTNAEGNFRLTTDSMIPVAGEKVKLRGFKGDGVKGLKGTQQVFNPSGNSFDVKVQAPAGYLYKGGGTVRRFAQKLYPVVRETSDIVGAATRKAGRVFFAPPGARRRKR